MKEDNMEREKRLELEVGNLQVEVAEYQEIIRELSEKLKAYQSKHGKVLVKGS